MASYNPWGGPVSNGIAWTESPEWQNDYAANPGKYIKVWHKSQGSMSGYEQVGSVLGSMTSDGQNWQNLFRKSDPPKPAPAPKPVVAAKPITLTTSTPAKTTTTETTTTNPPVQDFKLKEQAAAQKKYLDAALSKRLEKFQQLLNSLAL